MSTNKDDMEYAYQMILFQINEDVVKYVLSLIQDAGLEVDNLKDFLKGYYISKFSLILQSLHKNNGNPPNDPEIIIQEYLKKISSSEKLKGIMNKLI